MASLLFIFLQQKLVVRHSLKYPFFLEKAAFESATMLLFVYCSVRLFKKIKIEQL